MNCVSNSSWSLIILSVLIFEVSSSPHIYEAIVGNEKHVDKDDGEDWYPVEDINSQQSTKSNQLMSSEDDLNWSSLSESEFRKTIRNVFDKFGYDESETPVPFGSLPLNQIGYSVKYSSELIKLIETIAQKLPPQLEIPLLKILDSIGLKQIQISNGMIENGPPERIDEILEEMSENIPTTHASSRHSPQLISDSICEEDLNFCFTQPSPKSSDYSTINHPQLPTKIRIHYDDSNPTNEEQGKNEPPQKSTNEVGGVEKSTNEVGGVEKSTNEELEKEEEKIKELLEDIQVVVHDSNPSSRDEIKLSEEIKELENVIEKVEEVANSKTIPCSHQDNVENENKNEDDILSKDEEFILKEMWNKFDHNDDDKTSLFEQSFNDSSHLKSENGLKIHQEDTKHNNEPIKIDLKNHVEESTKNQKEANKEILNVENQVLSKLDKIISTLEAHDQKHSHHHSPHNEKNHHHFENVNSHEQNLVDHSHNKHHIRSDNEKEHYHHAKSKNDEIMGSDEEIAHLQTIINEIGAIGREEAHNLENSETLSREERLREIIENKYPERVEKILKSISAISALDLHTQNHKNRHVFQKNNQNDEKIGKILTSLHKNNHHHHDIENFRDRMVRNEKKLSNLKNKKDIYNLADAKYLLKLKLKKLRQRLKLAQKAQAKKTRLN